MSDDVYLAYPCEYRSHGKWGEKKEPAAVMISSVCPLCKQEPHLLNICGPCVSAKRTLVCPDCDNDFDPEDVWKLVFWWN